jgi:PRONE (Plant-specific Rop nucleotide exchanger)
LTFIFTIFSTIVIKFDCFFFFSHVIKQQYLETFKDTQEFWYVSKDSNEFKNNSTQREDDKWWLPTVKVQPGGLSTDARKHIEMIRRDTNQILKLAMAINANVLTEMQIPDAYIQNLPKVAPC